MHATILRRCPVALLTVLLFGGCKSETKKLGVIPPEQRSAPLTPGTRAQLMSQGAHCSPSSNGPAICTTTDPACTLTFDSNDQLTHLHCDVDGLIFDCTRPCPDLYECTWSDAPGCADLYDASGVFSQYTCGATLDARLQCGSDAGVAVDAGAIDGGGSICRGLDEQTCQATPTCTPISCGCNPPSYVGCFGPGDPTPGCVGCPVCQGLDEQSCAMNASCRADYCDACGIRRFVGCSDPGTQPAPCPAVTCPNCMGLDEQACSSTATCHPVYIDLQACGCAPAGCCTRFQECGQGAYAVCTPPTAICDALPPTCEGDFVLAYSNSCYEGCVHPRECGGQPALCGPGGTWPTFAKACQVDGDCAMGVHQTDCCGSVSAIGFSAGEQERFRQDELICEVEYPACGCAPRGGISAEDGNTANDQSQLHVRCQSSAAGGQCTTYVQ
jgi:hypothetical protein